MSEYKANWIKEKRKCPIFKAKEAAQSKIRRAEKYKDNPSIYSEAVKSYKYKDPKNNIRVKLISAKRRSKVKGLEFDISIEDFESFPTHCPLLGIELNYNQPESNKDHNIPSLDRINPNEGYIRGNVQIVSWRANDLKKDASLGELEMITTSLRRLLK